MRPVLAALALVFASQAFATGEVYKWTDEKGVVHYTETPPPDRAFEKKDVGPQPARVPDPVGDHAAATAEAAADGAEGSAPVAPKPGSAAANCENALKNVENLEKSGTVTADLDGDGKFELLTEAQRAEALERNRGLVTLFCPKEITEGQ